jgi:hypothetical protein
LYRARGDVGPRLEREGYHRYDDPIQENVREDRNADCGEDEGLRGAQSQQVRGWGALVDAGGEEVVDATHRRLPGSTRRDDLEVKRGRRGKIVSILLDEEAKHLWHYYYA